jgi:SPP1 gp7 family putative phage head morphogenesis protein
MPKTTSRKRRSNPIQIRGTEVRYASQLRKIAKHVGDVINGFEPGDPSLVPTISSVLEKYSEALTDWAKSTAARMLTDVAKRDEKAWMFAAKDLSRSLRDEIRSAPTGETMRRLLDEQVTLIKSIPLDAAKRVHRLTLEGIENSGRASEVAKEIMRSGEVAKSRATLIARTETSRTATVLTQARAEHIGSDGYVWRTSGDSDVRPSHRRMNGKFVPWNHPPTLDNLTGHAGALPNCRCYPEPVIPE